jgi:hypothetical protein
MLENLKRKLQEKIENNAVKLPDIYWTDKDGVNHTETIYLKRSRIPILGDWARIYPPVNEDGTWNLVNLTFGGHKNLIKLIVILGITAAAFYGYYQIFTEYGSLANNTCVQSCMANITP